MCHRSCSLTQGFYTKLYTKTAVSESSIALARLNLTFLPLGLSLWNLAHLFQCFSYRRFFASPDASSLIWTQVERFGRFFPSTTSMRLLRLEPPKSESKAGDSIFFTITGERWMHRWNVCMKPCTTASPLASVGEAQPVFLEIELEHRRCWPNGFCNPPSTAFHEKSSRKFRTNFAKLLSMRKVGVIRLSEASHDVEAVDVLVVDQLHSARKQFLQAVMDNLGARFPEMELVDSFSVFDPRNLPKLGDEQIDRYGIRQVDVLAHHFSKEQTNEGQAAQPGLVDYDMAVSELILLRSLMSTAYRGMHCEFVSSLLAKHANMFPALCVVASAAAVLPVSNASPERGFLTPNRILTKLRNRLLEWTLDLLMRISTEGQTGRQMDYRRALPRTPTGFPLERAPTAFS